MTTRQALHRCIEQGMVTLPYRRYIVYPSRKGSRAPRLLNLPSIKECRRDHICVTCRVREAIHYGLDGYGASCPECLEARRAKERRKYADRQLRA